MKYFITLFISLLVFQVNAQNLDRVEPPNWWAGMESTDLQLMIHGENISKAEISLDYPGVSLEAVTKVENPNYLFVDLKLTEDVIPGKFDIHFTVGKKEVATYSYELWERKPNSVNREGFNSSDVICLITPDRFANGDTTNDEVEGMKEGLNRSDKWGRHGGDIRGIINSLDYLKGLGYTAVWLNPVLENDMPRESYHGYACTDFYKVDARFGSNEEYLELKNELDKRGMKLIMDMIFNHCGSEHWWMHDMPMKDWINNYPDMKITTHRRTVNEDPHVSEADKKAMTEGWFVSAMPDMNQNNPYLAKYLIQNSIWWIEYVGLEGIRQDTWPYPDKYMMSDWTKELLKEYPHFNVVGEEWTTNPAIVSYWQKGKLNQDGYRNYAPSMMDFPLQSAASEGLHNEESFDYGLIQIYNALANDFLYPNPYNLTIFPDNHDMSRFYVQEGEDANLLKMGVAFFLTTRGIPQIYYGTEILMRHDGSEHGDIRADFPGGWAGDKVNAFTGEGLSDAAKDMQKYVATIQNWRKNATVIHNGKLMHFVPENGTYTYFRYTDDAEVMVILNKNFEEKSIDTNRFKEVMKGYKTGKEIISGTQLNDISKITVPARSAVIVELSK
ncbi:MAG TPA: glycoside hydrolase family 13 protein [Draconibacterium sp.]|nr:glycoside hydrolase family 13 protein [Draconibacterium sp.]